MQDSKRPRLSLVSTKCYGCGKFGHKSFECFSRSHNKQQTTSNFDRPNTAMTMTKHAVTCFKCGAEGHLASRYSKQWPAASSSNTQPAATSSVVKRVDVCGVKPVTGVITQFGEQFSFCFDSGADCSLVKKSISLKLDGKIQHAI